MVQSKEHTAVGYPLLNIFICVKMLFLHLSGSMMSYYHLSDSSMMRSYLNGSTKNYYCLNGSSMRSYLNDSMRRSNNGYYYPLMNYCYYLSQP